jgi:hypothetical protein
MSNRVVGCVELGCVVTKKDKIADDLLRGAGPIAEELFGNKDDARKVYGMSEEERKSLGLFYMGKLLCGLRSKMRERIAARAEAAQ